MASTIIQPVADKLKTLIESVTVGGVKLKTYRWAPPPGLDRLPAAVIELPDVRRTGVGIDDRETELGMEDWILSYPVTLYVALDEPEASQALACEYLEGLVGAIDDDPLLGALSGVRGTSVTESNVSYDFSDQARPMLAYSCRVECWRQVAA